MIATLRLISFPATSNLPVFAANALGLFRRHGVEVTLETTPSSMHLMKALIGGEFDIGCGAVDNVIAYQEGAGEVAVDREPDLFIVAGATQTEVSLVARPEITDYAALRGKRVALDALTTGFAFVLYRLIEDAGLKSSEVEMVSVGSTPSRWDAVQKGEYAGTLLIEPFTAMARTAGYHVLGGTLDFDHYCGQVFAASRGWAAAHRAELVGFLRGWLDALDWVTAAGNRKEAEAMLGRMMPQMKPQAIAPSMAKLLDPRTGLVPKAALDVPGLKTVLALRSEYAPQKKRLTDPMKYVDLSYYDEALKSR
jgi:ABC-type nitrate/sulfonate/bicarbonate transport system substrate-binding protein